ncbi:MAG: hypothetical protein K2Y23_13030, partial [Cyanobacteria bacterium]|nr:hypothetical protein [Cyanobacteriota bacterium]
MVVFGPNTYPRTAGPPNTYTVSFARPSGVTGPFTMRVVNGNANGTNRLSSARITLNGVEVASPSAFGQQVAAFDRSVSLQAQNTVEYRLTSAPQSFMTVTFYGTNSVSDTTAPQIAITTPVASSFTSSATIAVTLQASDPAGAAGAPISGLNQSSLRVMVDNVDLGSQFTWANGQAAAQLASLGEGQHTMVASIADNAGNGASSAAVSFTIDRMAPQVVIIDPAANQYTNAQTMEVHGGVVDATATTVVVDGIPAAVDTGAFTVLGVPLTAAAQQTITVTATDAAGNQGSATVTVHIDRVAPAVAITSPAVGVVLTGPQITVNGTVSDASTVFVTVNDEPMTVSGTTFSGQVPLPDGAATLTAKAHDLAGNETTVTRALTIDSVAPVITITEPSADAITNQSPIAVRGRVSDSSTVLVTAGGATVTPVNGLFEITMPLFSEGTNTLILTATDAAGNEALAGVNVTFDHTAPVVTITNPTGTVVSSLPLTVQGTAQELLTGVTVRVNGTPVTVSGSAWSTTISSLEEGQRTIDVEAIDGAGNTATTSKPVLVDLNAPIVTIASPSGGAMTVGGSTAVSGTVQDISVSALTVNGVAAALDPPSGNSPRGFTATVALSEGDNTIVALARDAADRETAAQVTVTRDSIAPSVALTLGPKVSPLRPVAASIVAADNLALDRVTVSVNGAIVQTFTAPPFALNISAPANARGGDSIAVVAEAIDRLGNRSQSASIVNVVSDGAVAGQVLTDADGLPLADAAIAVDGAATLASDGRGRYTFAAHDTHIALSISKADHTTVDRALDVAAETGSAAVDARLTKLSAATAVGSSAATIDASASISVAVPAGAFADGSSIRVTPLTGQGLPGLLPLGWSPLAAVDLRGSAPSLPLSLRVNLSALSVPAAALGSSAPSYLARYVNRTWHLTSGPLTPDANGIIGVALPQSEAISAALVVVDTGAGAPVVPALGDPLPGAAAVVIPLTATSTGVLDPPILSPSGGRSIGTLTVTSPTPLPSGTVVQANVTETFTLVSGDAISVDARTEDFVLYRAPAGLVASFPVVPSRSFDASTLAQGVVHLDILAGRESVRGSAGGNGSLSLTTTGATLSIAQGALTTGDVPIAFQSAVVSSFLPVTADVSPLLEFSIDFSGRDLSIGADLSVLASQLPGVTG